MKNAAAAAASPADPGSDPRRTYEELYALLDRWDVEYAEAERLVEAERLEARAAKLAAKRERKEQAERRRRG